MSNRTPQQQPQIAYRNLHLPASSQRSTTSPSVSRAHPYSTTSGTPITALPFTAPPRPGVVRSANTDPLRRYQPGRSTDKSKGLRHFSTKVCEKVKEKGQTSYNEVADELVQDYFAESQSLTAEDFEKQQYEMKNIRRRVYDALNVLMAMNIIQKERKEIRWVGLPTTSAQECERLSKEKEKREERIRQKTEQLHELMVQLVAYKALVARNRDQERHEGRPPANSLLYLPYIIVSTDKSTVVEVSISQDKTEYLFNFDQSFAIHDDIEVLKRLGLAYGLDTGNVRPEDIDAVRAYLPPALRPWVDRIVNGTLFERADLAPNAVRLVDIKTEAQMRSEGDQNNFGYLEQLMAGGVASNGDSVVNQQ